jgi:hypothetical protein
MEAVIVKSSKSSPNGSEKKTKKKAKSKTADVRVGVHDCPGVDIRFSLNHVCVVLVEYENMRSRCNG